MGLNSEEPSANPRTCGLGSLSLSFLISQMGALEQLLSQFCRSCVAPTRNEMRMRKYFVISNGQDSLGAVVVGNVGRYRQSPHTV